MVVAANFNDSDIFRPTAKALFSELDDGIVMLDVDSGEYLGLNLVSSRIWSLIEKNFSLSDIYSALRKEYQVDDETCKGDVQEFVAELLNRGLIENASD